MTQTKAQLAEKVALLSKPNPPVFFSYLMVDYFLVASAFGLYFASSSLPAFIAGSVLLGLAQHRLIVLGHEGVHFNICENRSWNDFIGNFFCFFPIGMTVSSYRDLHFPHHQNPYSKEDPEVPLRKALHKTFFPPFSFSRGFRLWLGSFVGGSIKEVFLFMRSMPNGKPIEKLSLALYWTAIVGIVLYLGVVDYIAMWSFGLITTFFSTQRIRGWYEHGINNNEKTSRYHSPGWWYYLLAPHNIWMHYEHHRYPNVPFFALPQVRDIDTQEPVLTLADVQTYLNQRPYAEILEGNHKDEPANNRNASDKQNSEPDKSVA